MANIFLLLLFYTKPIILSTSYTHNSTQVYSYLIASSGLSEAARLAGKIPVK